MRVALVSTAICLSLVGLSAADEARASVRRLTSIPEQELESALQSLARTRDLQVVYRTEVIGAYRSRGAAGELTESEALAQILSGTGLTYRYLDDQTITIVQAPTPVAGPIAGSSSAAAESPQPAHAPVDEVLVTGSRLLSSESDGAVPVRTVTSEQIARSGQSTVGSFLASLPEVSVAFTESINEGNSGSSTVQLHGLPAGTTLVLLNGKRLESGGSSSGKFFDLNSIPASAIERIDIIPVGSSAIYGSDALAGVVNIILKTDFDGAEISARYGSARGTDEQAYSAAWGHKWSRATVSLLGSYMHRDALGLAERSISANSDFRRFGGPDKRQTSACNPTTVASLNGGNLPGLAAPTAGAPAGLSGTATVADFAAGAGKPNLCSYYPNYFALPESDRLGGIFSLGVDLTSTTHLFAEFDASRVAQDPSLGPQILSPPLTLGAANPYNPFGVAVSLAGYLFPPNSSQVRNASWTTRFTRPVLGVKGEINSRWSWELSGWQARDRVDAAYDAFAVIPAALTAALTSSDPAKAFNPFASGDPATPDVLAGMFSPFTYHYDSKANVANGFVRGSLFDLPAGSLDVVVGGEWNRAQLDYVVSNRAASYERREKAVFGEVRVPLLDRGGSEQDLLAATAAVRHDRSNDYGGSTSPQFGLELRPVSSLLLRASYADAYRAPALDALLQVPTVPCAAACIIVNDPKRGGQSTTVLYTSGGNADLLPETGRSHSFGVVWDSEAIPGLRSSLTYWNVLQKNRVTRLASQVLIDNEDLFPGYVTRAPSVNGQPGVIQSYRNVYINFGSLDVAGWDVQSSYRIETAALGTFSPAIVSTYTTKYRAAVVPNAPEVDRVDHANLDGWAPRFKGTAALDWRLGAASASLAVRYTATYRDYDNARDEGPYAFVDASAGYDLRSLPFGGLGAKALELRAGAVNLFNRLPDFSTAASYGYDPTQADIRGRFAYLSLNAKW